MKQTPKIRLTKKIIADFKQAWHEAMTGQTRPARAAFEEIRRELEQDN